MRLSVLALLRPRSLSSAWLPLLLSSRRSTFPYYTRYRGLCVLLHWLQLLEAVVVLKGILPQP